MIRILRGPIIRFVGNPFLAADAMVHDADGALAIADGLIAAVGTADEVLAAYPDAPVQTTPHLIAPGFVDAHMHYPQYGVIASWGADLIDWLDRFTFPEEARFVDPAHAAAIAQTSFDAQLANGVTTSASFCTIHSASVDAYFHEAARRGLRTVGGKVMMDRNAPPDLRDTAQSGYDDSKALIARWHGVGRTTYAITPRFAPTSTPAQLQAAGTLWAEHPDCPMQTHLSEQHREIDWVTQLFPGDPDYLAVYERFGLSGPGAIFGHAIHLTQRERQALADQGASVAHCPTSNQFLGSGACAVTDLMRQGIPVGLATDTGGGTAFSMFDTMKAAYEVGRARGDTLTPEQLWWLATQGAARTLRLQNTIGNIAPGCEADLILIDPAATPVLAARSARANHLRDLLFALIMLADDRAIRCVLSAGKQVWPTHSPDPN